jgi:8-oxo-dGTP pyrophosphatase MutT (NUDIX family)
MPTPAFVSELRSLIGHRLLWLPSAAGVVLDKSGRLLLGRRADTGGWALPGGIVDPAEPPADAAVREIFEETGVLAVPDELTSVTISAPVTYPNRDQVQYLEFTFRCRVVGGAARVNDSESVEVRWYPLDALPDLSEGCRRRLSLALEHSGKTAYAFSGLAEVLGRPD